MNPSTPEPSTPEPITPEPSTPEPRTAADALYATPPLPPLWLVRALVVLSAAAGLTYVSWRWTSSVQWGVWWIAVPLVVAETYSLIDTLLFGLTVWRLRTRPEPPAAKPGLTVDVFITTVNEPVALLRATAEAALRITYPHTTWILDDGSRPEVRDLAAELGIGWLTRSGDWQDRDRHAKAGNLNNALMATDGEFLLILDADQIAAPQILDRTLGYFTDEEVALVQTRQFFSNVLPADPLGSQAPLFYGPIQQGKDGWNAAFFCGSNAVVRREALMRLGVSRYVTDVEREVLTALGRAGSVIRHARRTLPVDQSRLDPALAAIEDSVRRTRTAVRDGQSLADATRAFQRDVVHAVRELVRRDAQSIRFDLAVLGEPGGVLDEAALDRLSQRDLSPLNAIESVSALIRAIDVDREHEAQPVMPMSVISVTEDLATCMRLHAQGWTTVYHDETLALGLAPEDAGTMLRQRLRWAQGTMQVMFRENPLFVRGLRPGQRLMYLATMWSYLSGFAALAYLAAPVLFLGFGVLPVQALSSAFFSRLVPFLVLSQALFWLVGRGRGTWRGQQFALALFPVWIQAVVSAAGQVFLGRSLTFAVTPKHRTQPARGTTWRPVWPQLTAMALLAAAAVAGTVRWAAGSAGTLATAVNVGWVVFDLALLWAVVPAARYQGYHPEYDTHPAAVLTPAPGTAAAPAGGGPLPQPRAAAPSETAALAHVTTEQEAD